MQRVVYEGVEDDDGIVWTIVAGKLVAPGDFSIPVADIDADGVGFEVIAEDFVAVAKDAHALGVAHVIAIVKAIVAMALADFAAATIQNGVVTIGIAAGFVGDDLILALAMDEEVVFNDGIAGGHAQAA